MDCGNQIGVRNIFLTLFDCDNNVTYGPVVHELAGDDQPTYKTCPYSNEALTGGFVKRNRSNQMMNMTVIRNKGIPLALYQGCASIGATVEHFDGMIMSGVAGTTVGDEASDGHEVSLEIIFEDIDEFLAQQLEARAA